MKKWRQNGGSNYEIKNESILTVNKIKYKIELADFKNIILRLNQTILKVQKSSKALKDFIITNDERTEAEIKSILEEREEFSRIKLIKNF